MGCCLQTPQENVVDEDADEAIFVHRTINAKVLWNILEILSYSLEKNEDLHCEFLKILLLELRSKEYSIYYVQEWIKNHIDVLVTPEESEYVMSYINMHAPTETESLADDVKLLRTRCSLIPPHDGQELREWLIKVKLLEKSFKMATGMNHHPPGAVSGSGATTRVKPNPTAAIPSASAPKSASAQRRTSSASKLFAKQKKRLSAGRIVVGGDGRPEDARLVEQRRKSMSAHPQVVTGGQRRNEVESALHTSRSDH